MKQIAKALDYIDEFIWLAIWLVGLVFVIWAIAGGSSVVEVGLLVVVTAYAALRWTMDSPNVRAWLRGRDP